jgi:glycosyltransferase involved in cell wall biosynthesis
MKVIFVSNTFSSFLQHRYNLAKEVAKSHKLIVCIPEQDLADAAESSKEFTFQGYSIGRKSINPFKELVTIWSLYRIYKKEKPDLVHHFTIKPVIYGSLVARIIGINRIVNTITGLGYVFTGGSFLANLLKILVVNLYRLVLRSKKVQVIFQNPDDKELFENMNIISKDTTHLVLGSGVDIGKFSTMTPTHFEKVRVLIPARMLWDKGISEAIQAAEFLKNKGLNFELILVGKEDLENPAGIKKELLLNWTASGLANWIGFQKDMPTVIRTSDIICLPSYREGVPMAILEGMAASKPIVTTDVPGCRETISSSTPNGFLVPAKNPVALADSLEKLINNKSLREEMGHNSFLHVQKFSKEKIVTDIVKIYNLG